MIGVERLPEKEVDRPLLALATALLALLVALGGCATTAPSTPESTASAPPPTATATATGTPQPTITQPPIATPTITLTPTPGILLRVNVAGANFRAGPGTHYRVMDVLTYDTEVTVIGRTEDRAWYNVLTEDGKRGWLGASVIYYVDLAQSQQVETVSTMPPPPPTPVPPPTWTPGPQPSAPESPSSEEPPPRRCCKICRRGKACGDTCINHSYTCHVGPGCACNAGIDAGRVAILGERWKGSANQATMCVPGSGTVHYNKLPVRTCSINSLRNDGDGRASKAENSSHVGM